jgi:hypothetical protein
MTSRACLGTERARRVRYGVEQPGRTAFCAGRFTDDGAQLVIFVRAISRL